MRVLDVIILICLYLLSVVAQQNAISQNQNTAKYATTSTTIKATAKTEIPILTTNAVTQFLDLFTQLPGDYYVPSPPELKIVELTPRGYDYDDIWWTTNTSPTKNEVLPEDNNTEHLVNNIFKLRADISLLRDAISKTKGLDTTTANLTNILKKNLNTPSKKSIVNKTKLAVTPAETSLNSKQLSVILKGEKVSNILKGKQVNGSTKAKPLITSKVKRANVTTETPSVTISKANPMYVSSKLTPVTLKKVMQVNVTTKTTQASELKQKAIQVTILNANQEKLIPRAGPITKTTRSKTTLPEEVALFFQLGGADSQLESMENQLRGFGYQGNGPVPQDEGSREETTPETMPPDYGQGAYRPPRGGQGAFRPFGGIPEAFGRPSGMPGTFGRPGGMLAYGPPSDRPGAFVPPGGEPGAFGLPGRGAGAFGSPVGRVNGFRSPGAVPAGFGRVGGMPGAFVPPGGGPGTFGLPGGVEGAFGSPVGRVSGFRPSGGQQGTFEPPVRGSGAFGQYSGGSPGMRPAVLRSPNGEQGIRGKEMVRIPAVYNKNIPSSRIVDGARKFDGVDPFGMEPGDDGDINNDDNAENLKQNVGGLLEDLKKDIAATDGFEDNHPVSHKIVLGPIADKDGAAGEIMADIDPKKIYDEPEAEAEEDDEEEEYEYDHKVYLSSTRPMNKLDPNYRQVPLPFPEEPTSKDPRGILDTLSEDIEKYAVRDSIPGQTRGGPREIGRNGPEEMGPGVPEEYGLGGAGGYGPGGAGGFGQGGPGGFGPGGPANFGSGGPGAFGPGGIGAFGPGGPGTFGPGGPEQFGPGGPEQFGPGGPGNFGPGSPRNFGPGGPINSGPGGPGNFGPGGPGNLGPDGPGNFGPGGPGNFGPGGPGNFGPGVPGNFGPGGLGKFGPDGPGNFGPGGPGYFGPGVPGNFGTDGLGKFGPDGPGNFGPGGPGNFGPSGPGNFGPGGPGNFGPGGPGNFGPDGPGNFGPGGPMNFRPDGPGNLGPGGPGNFGPGGPGNLGPDVPGNFGPGGPGNLGPDVPGNFGPGNPGNLGPGGPQNYVSGGLGNFGPDGTGNFGPGGPMNFRPDGPGNLGPGGPGNFGPGGPGNLGPDVPGNFGPGYPGNLGPDVPGNFGPGGPINFRSDGPGNFGPGNPGNLGPGGPQNYVSGGPGNLRPDGPGNFGPGGPGNFMPGGSGGFGQSGPVGLGPEGLGGLGPGGPEEFRPRGLESGVPSKPDLSNTREFKPGLDRPGSRGPPKNNKSTKKIKYGPIEPGMPGGLGGPILYVPKKKLNITQKTPRNGKSGVENQDPGSQSNQLKIGTSKPFQSDPGQDTLGTFDKVRAAPESGQFNNIEGVVFQNGQGSPRYPPSGPGYIDPYKQGGSQFQPSGPSGQGVFGPKGDGSPQFQQGGPSVLNPKGEGGPQFQLDGPPGQGILGPKGEGPQFQLDGPPGQGVFGPKQEGPQLQPGGPPKQGVMVFGVYAQGRGFGQGGVFRTKQDSESPTYPTFTFYKDNGTFYTNTNEKRRKTGYDGKYHGLHPHKQTTQKGKPFPWYNENEKPQVNKRIKTNKAVTTNNTNTNITDEKDNNTRHNASEFLPSGGPQEPKVGLIDLQEDSQPVYHPITVNNLLIGRNPNVGPRSNDSAAGLEVPTPPTQPAAPTMPTPLTSPPPPPTPTPTPTPQPSIPVTSETSTINVTTATTQTTTIDVEGIMSDIFPEEVNKPTIDVEVTVPTRATLGTADRLSSLLEEFEGIGAAGIDSAFIAQLKKDKERIGGGYFTLFLYKLCQIISTKSDKSVVYLTAGFGNAVRMFDTENMLVHFGEPFGRAAKNFAEHIMLEPPDLVKSQAALSAHALENRQELLGKDLKAMLAYFDGFFKITHAKKIYRLLEDLHLFPDINYNGYRLCRNSIQTMILDPFSEIYSTPARPIFLEVLNRYIAKTFYEDEPIMIPQRRRSSDKRYTNRTDNYRRKYKHSDKRKRKKMVIKQGIRKRSHREIVDSQEIEKENILFMIKQQNTKAADRKRLKENITNSIQGGNDDDLPIFASEEDEMSTHEVTDEETSTPKQVKSAPKPIMTIGTEDAEKKYTDLEKETRSTKKHVIHKSTKHKKRQQIRATSLMTTEKYVKRIIYVKHSVATKQAILVTLTKPYFSVKKVNITPSKQWRKTTFPNNLKLRITGEGLLSAVNGTKNKQTNKVIASNKVKNESYTPQMTNTLKFPTMNIIRNNKGISSSTLSIKKPETDLEMFSEETSDTEESTKEENVKKRRKHKRPQHKKKSKKRMKHKQKALRQKHHKREKHGHKKRHRKLVKNNKGRHRNHPRVYEIYLKKHKRKHRNDHSHFNYEKKLNRYNIRKRHHKRRKHAHKRRKKHQHIKRKKYDSNYRRDFSNRFYERSKFTPNNLFIKNDPNLKKNVLATTLQRRYIILQKDKKSTQDFHVTSVRETKSSENSSCSSSQSSSESESNSDIPQYSTDSDEKFTNNFIGTNSGGFRHDSKVKFNREHEELSIEVFKDTTSVLRRGKEVKLENANKNTTEHDIRHVSSESDQEHVLKKRIYQYFDGKNKVNLRAREESKEKQVLRRNLLKNINFKQVIDSLSQKLKLKQNIAKVTKMKPLNELSSYSDEEEILKKKLNRLS